MQNNAENMKKCTFLQKNIPRTGKTGTGISKPIRGFAQAEGLWELF